MYNFLSVKKNLDTIPKMCYNYSMIDCYKFGHLVLDGKRYFHDVIILPDGGIKKWWREEGHRVKMEDLKEIKNIDTLIVGTGAYGMMRVDKEVMNEFEKRGIKVIIAPTKEAIYVYNSSPEERTAACLHLTC